MMKEALHLTSWLVACIPSAFVRLLHSAKVRSFGIHSIEVAPELPWVVQPNSVQVKINDLWLGTCSA